MFIVDRIEEGLAVIYDDEGKHFNVDVNKIIATNITIIKVIINLKLIVFFFI